MTLQSRVRRLAMQEHLYNAREQPIAYSIFYSTKVKRYLFFKRGLWKMSNNDVLLNKQGAIIICSILNK